jgi:hypothetical protein
MSGSLGNLYRFGASAPKNPAPIGARSDDFGARRGE